MDCIDLAQDGDQWRALVSTVMNFWLNKMQEFLEYTISGFSRKAQLYE
jgi:hypothetical protein